MNATKLALLTLLSCSTAAVTAGEKARFPNTLTDDEYRSGFELLFDGQSLDGWRTTGNWRVERESIHRERAGESLVFAGKRLPDDFELRFEWLIDRGGESGLLYRPGLYEYQIVDDARHPLGRNPRTSSGALTFCMPPAKNATNPTGRWNTGRIVCQGTVIQHWVNGTKVVDFDYTESRWQANVHAFLRRGGRLAARPTSLRLQDAGSPVWFRTIRLRELRPQDDVGHSTVVPPPVDEAVLRAEAKELEAFDRLRATGRPSH